jgi:hypothetical protein
VRIRRAFENGADQSRVERSKKLHGLDGRLSPLSQQLWLAVGEKQALVFTQRILNLEVARECLRIEDAQAFGRLQLGVVKIADAVLAHQASCFLGYA